MMDARAEPGEILRVLRDLMAAVEVAEDNEWSETSRRLVSGAADRAADAMFRLRRMPRTIAARPEMGKRGVSK